MPALPVRLRRLCPVAPSSHHLANIWLACPPLPCRLHYFDYEHKGASYLIWGLTAGMLIVVAEKAFGRRPAFQPTPPNALPYTSIVHDGQRLMYRLDGDVLGLAGEAAAEESPRSAAVPGAVVTDVEAAAALGGAAEGDEEAGSEDGSVAGAC